MLKGLQEKAAIFVRNLVELDNAALALPNRMYQIFSVLTAMLNFSYLQNNKQNNIFYICQVLARPHIYIRQYILGYLVVFFNVCYLISIFYQFPGRKFASLYGQLMRTGLMNFILEVSNSPVCYINQSMGILISGLQHFYCQRNIDIIIKNTFPSIKFGFLNHIIWILSIIQSLSWYYNININGLYTITIIHTLFSWKATNSSVDSSIYCFTLLMTIFDFSQFIYDISSILVIYPLILKFSFLLKSDKHADFILSLSKPEAQLIQASKFIEQKMYIKGLNKLNEIKSEGILLQIRRQMLRERCLIKIQEIIDANSSPQQSLIESLSQKIEMEEKYYRIITEFQSFLHQRIRLLQLTNFEDFQLFYQFLEQIVNYQEKFNKVSAVTNQYKSLQLFFNAEISHDLHELQQLQNSKEVVNYSSFEVEKMAYIISVYDKGLRVLSASKSPLISQDNQVNIDQFIPPGIREWHTQLVEQFLTTGKSKFLQRLEMNLIVQKNEKVMTYIDFGFTTCITNELKFITYMELSPEQPMTMILNQQLQITCLSEKLLSSFNMGSYNYYGQQIKKFIPYFQVNEIYQENIEIYIGDQESEIPLVTSIRISTKYLDDQPIYYLLYFDFIRKSSQRIKSASQFTQQPSYMGISEGIPDNRAKSDIDINFQFNIPEEENLQVPYYEDDGNQQSIMYAQQLDDNTNIYSPGHNQSRQKLIRRDTFASKFQKISLNQDQNENIIEFPKVHSKFHLRKDYVFEFYEQPYSVTKNFKISLTLSMLIVLIFYLLQAAKVNADLTTLVSDIDVLNFGQMTFQPLQSNLLIAFALSEYALYYVYQYITYQQYKYLVTFPAETFPIGFQRIENNLNSLFQQPSLTNILDDNSLEIYQYTNTSVPEIYDVTLRNAFGMLLSFQYDGLIDVIKNKKLNADSGYAYFTFKNYLPLKQIVTDLNSILLEQTITIAENDNNLLTILLIVEMFMYSLPYLLSYYYFILIQKQVSRYYNILLQLSYEQKQAETSHYKQLLHQITQDYECLLNYKCKVQKIVQDKSRIKRLKQHNQLKYKASYWKLTFLFFFIFIILKSVLLYYYTQNYFSEYKDIAHFYRSLSDLSIDITSIYSAREVLYFRTSFTYLDNDTIAELLVLIEESLNRTVYFQQHEFIKEKTILSESFQNYYESITEGNLCSQLPTYLQNSTSSFCSQLFSGNMENGLLSCLTNMINDIRTELNLNQFKQKLSIELYDMEGPYLLSQIVDQLYQQLRQDLLNYTNHLLYVMNIINISSISLIGLIIIMSKVIIFDRIDRLLYISKRFVIFIPLETLIYDEAIERFIRNLMYKQLQ